MLLVSSVSRNIIMIASARWFGFMKEEGHVIDTHIGIIKKDDLIKKLESLGVIG